MATRAGRPTEHLRAEHDRIRHDASHLARVAAELSDWSAPDTPDELQRLRGFFYGWLLPHAQSEEAILYPLLDRVMGAEQSTRTMAADHTEIHERVDALTELITGIGQGPPTESETEALREHLYALWAIVQLHLKKEETILFPLLDEHLSATDVQTLEEKMRAFLGQAP